MEITKDNLFFHEIKELLHSARRKVVTNVNTTMVLTYFEMGKKIVEEEKKGDSNYGKAIIEELSKRLTEEFGKGFSKTNLRQMKNFFLSYEKQQTVSAEFKLSWSHYLVLMRIDNTEERKFYEIESLNNNWSLRELRRQFDTGLYERLVLSRNKEEVKKLSQHGYVVEKPKDVIKDPYVLEFLGLPELNSYSEADLESEIINHIEKFIMELGKGFLFQGRQVRFTFDEEHFFVDLVFYNRILKCFVLIDLKIGKLKHQDIGQMQMYVNYYDRFVKMNDENKTIGIIICKEKNDTLVEITLPEDNEQIFASKYMTVLPSKEELKRIVEEEENDGK
jgi:predicted nuclease of restriction endonuclease-like (RecB) superfamily